jgi:hypothetical protein
LVESGLLVDDFTFGIEQRDDVRVGELATFILPEVNAEQRGNLTHVVIAPVQERPVIGTEFSSITELVKHCGSIPFGVERDQQKVHLAALVLGKTALDAFHVFKDDGTSVFAMSEKQANYLRPSTEDIQTNGFPDIGSPLRVE